jgi:hypothetical protein
MEVGDEDWDTGSLDGEYDFSAATTTTSSSGGTTATEVIVATKEVLSEEEDLELLVVYKHSTGGGGGGGGDPQAESMLEEKRVRVSSNATLNHLLKKLKVAFDLPKIDESALELSDYDPVTQQVPHSLPSHWALSEKLFTATTHSRGRKWCDDTRLHTTGGTSVPQLGDAVEPPPR